MTIVSGIFRTLNFEFMATMMMYRCEQTYRQNDKILETIDVLLADTKHSKCILFIFLDLEIYINKSREWFSLFIELLVFYHESEIQIESNKSDKENSSKIYRQTSTIIELINWEKIVNLSNLKEKISVIQTQWTMLLIII